MSTKHFFDKDYRGSASALISDKSEPHQSLVLEDIGGSYAEFRALSHACIALGWCALG